MNKGRIWVYSKFSKRGINTTLSSLKMWMFNGIHNFISFVDVSNVWFIYFFYYRVCALTFLHWVSWSILHSTTSLIQWVLKFPSHLYNLFQKLRLFRILIMDVFLYPIIFRYSPLIPCFVNFLLRIGRTGFLTLRVSSLILSIHYRTGG